MESSVIPEISSDMIATNDCFAQQKTSTFNSFKQRKWNLHLCTILDNVLILEHELAQVVFDYKTFEGHLDHLDDNSSSGLTVEYVVITLQPLPWAAHCSDTDTEWQDRTTMPLFDLIFLLFFFFYFKSLLYFSMPFR